MYLKRKNLHFIIKLLLFFIIALLSFLIISNWASAETLSGSGNGTTDTLKFYYNNKGVNILINRTYGITDIGLTNVKSSECTVSDSTKYITDSYDSYTQNRYYTSQNIFTNKCRSSSTNYNVNTKTINFNGQDIDFSGIDLKISSMNANNILGFFRTDTGSLSGSYFSTTLVTQGFCIKPAESPFNTNMFPSYSSASGGWFYSGNSTISAFPEVLYSSFISYDDSSNYCISHIGAYFSQGTSKDFYNSQFINIPLWTIDKYGDTKTISSPSDVLVTNSQLVNNYSYNDFESDSWLFVDYERNNHTPIFVNSSDISYIPGADIGDSSLGLDTLFSIKPLDDGVISSFVSIPIKLLNKLQIVFSQGICKPLNFGPITIGSKEFNFTYPCYNLVDITSSTFVSTIDYIFCFIIIYRLCFTFIDIFYTVSSLRDLGVIGFYTEVERNKRESINKGGI